MSGPQRPNRHARSSALSGPPTVPAGDPAAPEADDALVDDLWTDDPVGPDATAGPAPLDLPLASTPSRDPNLLGAIVLVSALIMGLALVVLGRQSGSSKDETAAPTTTAAAAPLLTVPAASQEPVGVAGQTVPSTDDTPTTTVDPTADPTTSSTGAAPHRSIYKGGKLYLVGTVPSKEVGDAFAAKAEAVLGKDNVINEYTYDPSVPIPTDGTVEVGDQFVFATNSATLDPAYHSTLDLAATALTIFPNATAEFIGYTDDVGSEAANLDLSKRRAQAVVDYIASKGVDPSRMVAIGKGSADPIVPNTSDANRARNRRIEFKLIGLLK